jgi:hypothetical protein
VKSRLAERSVKRLEIIGFFAAIGQIKQDGGRYDWHAGRACSKAASGLGQFLHDRLGCGQTEGRATGQDERIDCLDRAARIEKLGFSGAWRLPQDRDAGGGGRIEQHNTGAGFGVVIARMAHTDADDIARPFVSPLCHMALFPCFVAGWTDRKGIKPLRAAALVDLNRYDQALTQGKSCAK